MYEGFDPRYEICSGIDGDNVPLEGDGIEIDFCAAAEYYQMASEQDHKSGTSSLARMYEFGFGVEQSFTEAERLLQLAGDHDDAKLRLAHFYEHGRAGAIAKDELKAFAMYQELVDDEFMDEQNASCRLACMYRDGRGVPQNRSRAYDILNNEEVSQDANVCYLHASMLLEEAQGPLRDTPKAMRLLKIAVLEDHTDAQYLLGRQLEDTRPRRAIKLLKKASRKHHVEATFRLACLIFDGKGLAQNYEAAAKLFMEIVAKGHVEASVRLAEMHECGNGVAQNIDIAVMLFTLAAEKGNPRAQCRLACLYRDGCGVLQDEKKAFELFRLAALQGLPQAQYDLARMYLHGNGSVRSRSEANRWFHKATAQGYTEAAGPHQPSAVEGV
jgi:TPR repeat protein